MTSKTKKVFIGLTDIASQVGIYKYGFEANGVETMTAIYERHSTNVSGHSDYVIHDPSFDAISIPGIPKSPFIRNSFRNLTKEYIWEKAMDECDTFMFIWAGFNSDYSHYEKLKAKGKRIITNFVGNDIRWKPAAEQEFKRHSLQPLEFRDDYYRTTKLVQQLHYLRMAEKYSDVIISLPNQSQLALRPYINFYYPLNVEEYRENSSQRFESPVIVHAPTNREFKGTRYVLEVFNRLEKEGIHFTPLLLEKIPHNEIANIYMNSDMLVGQLLCPGGGKQAFELLACGKVVLTRMGFRNYPQMAESDSPIIDVGPEDLYDHLKSLIINYEERLQIAKKGRAYAEAYHDVKKICKNILDILDSNSSEETFDFAPSFFREHFLPESEDTTWLYNKYTSLVKHCSWYKKHIKPGKRDGLIF